MGGVPPSDCPQEAHKGPPGDLEQPEHYVLCGQPWPGPDPSEAAQLGMLKHSTGKACLTLLTRRWFSGAGPWAAVASGRGPSRDLCPGGRDPSEAPGLRKQAVARGTSLAWAFQKLLSPTIPEAELQLRAEPSVPCPPPPLPPPSNKETHTAGVAFNSPGPDLQPSLHPSTSGLQGRVPRSSARLPGWLGGLWETKRWP